MLRLAGQLRRAQHYKGAILILLQLRPLVRAVSAPYIGEVAAANFWRPAFLATELASATPGFLCFPESHEIPWKGEIFAKRRPSCSNPQCVNRRPGRRQPLSAD
jgi:hypothetical protein